VIIQKPFSLSSIFIISSHLCSPPTIDTKLKGYVGRRVSGAAGQQPEMGHITGSKRGRKSRPISHPASRERPIGSKTRTKYRAPGMLEAHSC
jgi:hypothetical protein